MEHKIYYLDDKNNFVDKDKATHAMIQVFDENGTLVQEIYEKLNAKAESIKTPEDYMTDDQIREEMKKL